MLPYIDKFGGKHVVMNFKQSRLFNLALNTSTQQGACAAISRSWIDYHNRRRMDLFIRDTNAPDRISDIADFQYKYNYGYGSSILQIPGLNRDMYIRFWPARHNNSSILSAEYVVDLISRHNGYLHVGFHNIAYDYGHVIAMLIDDNGGECFDPNYGSAKFNLKNNLLEWLKYYFTMMPFRDEVIHMDGVNSPGAIDFLIFAQFSKPIKETKSSIRRWFSNKGK